MRRLMIAAMESGGGKTTVTCALLSLLRKQGIPVQAFKCGPDYIDPMYHTRILGRPGHNLDLFLQGERGVLQTLDRSGSSFALMEGAMGLFDGVGGTEQASSYALAALTDTPVLLVVTPKGSALTLAAQIQGLQGFRKPDMLAGLFLNRCKPSLAAYLAPILKRETGLDVVGCLPPMEAAALPSRHLGLVTAGEIDHLSKRFEEVAEQLQQTLSAETLLALSADAPLPTFQPIASTKKATPIAVARDEAFCFYYQESLDALERSGAELRFFSPLHDSRLPGGIGGLYLGGGYPELYAEGLSDNAAMRSAIGDAVSSGLPTIAECGGFLYLQKTLQNESNRAFPMAGVFPGEGFATGRLQRFGYLHLCPEEDSMLFRAGEQIPAHEFHYWDSTENGTSILCEKPLSRRRWRCGYTSPTLYAAFPHLHLGGELPLAQRFVNAARTYLEALCTD